MNENGWISLASIAATLLASLAACVFTYLTQRDAKRLARLEKRNTKLREEVKARIAIENCACEWLAELHSDLGKPSSEFSIKLKLRKRTQELTGLRPRLSNKDVTD
jgi:hypothetical protein